MKSFSFDNKIGKYLLTFVQKYDHAKYWSRREIVVDLLNRTNILLKIYYLYYKKITDSYHRCSFDANLNSGTNFKSPPILPYGSNGIIVGHDLIIGNDLVIFHQVTLAHVGSVIGSNVIFGAVSKLLSGFNVGKNSKIGANCLVIEDLPVNAIVVLNRPRIIIK